MSSSINKVKIRIYPEKPLTKKRRIMKNLKEDIRQWADILFFISAKLMSIFKNLYLQ